MKAEDYQSIENAKKYKNFRFQNGLNIIHQDERRLILEWLEKIKLNQDFLAIDLGAGTGRATKILLEANPQKVYAIDSSKAMLKILSEELKPEIKNRKVQIINNDSENFEFAPAIFDMVISLHLFKHLPNLTPTLAKINNVLKKGGYLMFDSINKYSLVQFRMGSCYAYSLKELEKKLNQNGFIINDIKFMHIFGETIYGFSGASVGEILNMFDKLLSIKSLGLSTKIFILAQKQ